MPKSHRTVFLGDLHTGGGVSVADPDRSGLDMWTPVREQLYRWWQAAAADPRWHAPDVLVVNGDAQEGINRKENALGLWEPDGQAQVWHSCGLVEQWAARSTYVTRGSGYHGKVGNLPLEEYFAREIGAEVYPHQEHMPTRERQRSGYQLYLTVGEYTFHIQHHVPVSKVWHYRTTPLARELLYGKVNDALRYDMGKYKTNVMVRSHAHYFNYVEYGSTRGFVLPCWKGLDEFLLSRGGIAISPDIGFIGIEITEDGRLEYEKKLWPIELAQKPPHVVVGFQPKRKPRRGGRARAGRSSGKR